ncbi:arylalcohol dehydrogenase, partial [Moniliophthora roreri]
RWPLYWKQSDNEPNIDSEKTLTRSDTPRTRPRNLYFHINPLPSWTGHFPAMPIRDTFSSASVQSLPPARTSQGASAVTERIEVAGASESELTEDPIHRYDVLIRPHSL